MDNGTEDPGLQLQVFPSKEKEIANKEKTSGFSPRDARWKEINDGILNEAMFTVEPLSQVLKTNTQAATSEMSIGFLFN